MSLSAAVVADDRVRDDEHAGVAAFCELFGRLLDDDAVVAIERKQAGILSSLAGANAQLYEFNQHSANEYNALAGDLQHATRSMRAVKANLDQIFRQIRTLKTLVAKLHPDETARAAAQHVFAVPDDDDNEDQHADDERAGDANSATATAHVATTTTTTTTPTTPTTTPTTTDETTDETTTTDESIERRRRVD